MQKKSFYVLAALFLVLILVVLIIWLQKDRATDIKMESPLILIDDAEIVPVFMTDIEKTDLGLPMDAKVQVLNRSESGRIMTYKVIRADDEIVTNRSQLRVRE